MRNHPWEWLSLEKRSVRLLKLEILRSIARLLILPKKLSHTQSQVSYWNNNFHCGTKALGIGGNASQVLSNKSRLSFFLLRPPLFEEKRYACCFALIFDVNDPFRLHRSGMVSTFAANDDPVDPSQIHSGQRTYERLTGEGWIIHGIEKHHPGFFPGIRFVQRFRVKGYVKPVPVFLNTHGIEAEGHHFRITKFAPLGHLAASGDRIPGTFGPFDRLLCHDDHSGSVCTKVDFLIFL